MENILQKALHFHVPLVITGETLRLPERRRRNNEGRGISPVRKINARSNQHKREPLSRTGMRSGIWRVERQKLITQNVCRRFVTRFERNNHYKLEHACCAVSPVVQSEVENKF